MGQLCFQYLSKAAGLVTLSLLPSSRFQVILWRALLYQQAPQRQGLCTVLQGIWRLTHKESPLTGHLNVVLLFPHRPSHLRDTSTLTSNFSVPSTQRVR